MYIYIYSICIYIIYTYIYIYIYIYELPINRKAAVAGYRDCDYRHDLT